MIQWNDSWNTGIELIDKEHRRLIELLARMERELTDPSSFLRTELLALSSEVTNHITNHFAHEEHLAFQLLGPEDVQNHVRAHREWRQLLLRELGALNMNITETRTDEELIKTAKHFVFSISEFFSKHFESHDCKFCAHSCLNS